MLNVRAASAQKSVKAIKLCNRIGKKGLSSSCIDEYLAALSLSVSQGGDKLIGKLLFAADEHRSVYVEEKVAFLAHFTIPAR
jgi:hypothetical protein